ncbi:MAG: D-2-hydroxyacid dehydrogenase [Bryobacterales bacterium]|nr:D-2-hydroxyacid dehydrogenase [Bryobacterales bacterium]
MSEKISRRGFMAATPLSAAAREPVVVEPFPVRQGQVGSQPLRILTLQQFEPAEVERIRQAGGNVQVEVIIVRSREDFRRRLPEAEVVFGSLSGSDLDHAPRLKWLQASAAGVEWMDARLRASPVVVTNCARVFAPGISETAMGMLLCLTRGITKYYFPQFLRREWKPVGSPRSDDHIELAGRTMGIVGMGGIGMALARRAYYGFDMRVVGTDAKPIPKPEYVAELRDPGWFEEMVPQADVLVAAAPHTAQTDRMFNERVFRRMKRTAYFLALSRGQLFDDMALVRALKEGWIAGAGLDVFPQEPPPPDHPIFDCPNVVMTMHTSGWSRDRQRRLIEFFAENVRRYVNGLPLLNVVDKQRGY